MADWDIDTPQNKKGSAPEGRASRHADGLADGSVNDLAGGPAESPADKPPGAAEPPARPASAEAMAPQPATTSRPVRSETAPLKAVPKRRRLYTLLSAVVAVLALLVVGAVAGYFIARSQLDDQAEELAEAWDELRITERALSDAEERNWNYFRENEALMLQLEQAQSGATTSTTEPASGLGRTYGDGVYLVDEDILPGTYDGVVTAEVGYWARLKATDGLVASIVANGLPRGAFVLTIYETDRALELRGVVITAR